ncbi:UNVERIFIED_CONTAM: hypothetical protein K2H54_027363 [Gekko kuhli]
MQTTQWYGCMRSVFDPKQEQFQANPDSYNGAVRENYSWSQDYSDLEIKVPVPKHILKGRQVMNAQFVGRPLMSDQYLTYTDTLTGPNSVGVSKLWMPMMGQTSVWYVCLKSSSRGPHLHSGRTQ